MAPATIHIWPVELGDPARWGPLLSPDEHARARQFRRAGDAAAYVACRGVLRALLGEFLGRDPSAIRFDYGAHEKPLLEDRACAFNVSRSSGLALIGITATGALGIDLEQFRDDVDVDAVAKQFFASADRAALEMVSPGKRSREFFHLWVRHEAAVKATGAGVVVPAQDLASMWVADVDIGRNYAAAVAAAGEGPYTVMMHPWSGEPHP